MMSCKLGLYISLFDNVLQAWPICSLVDNDVLQADIPNTTIAEQETAKKVPPPHMCMSTHAHQMHAACV